MNFEESNIATYSSPPTLREDRKLILSVDDEHGVLFSRYKVLSAEGYAVMSASDGVQALGIFGTEKIDLVLLDFVLPDMDGGALAQAIKALSPEVPIVMVSGAEVPEHCLSLCDGLVRKGDGVEPLLRAVRNLLYPTLSPDVGCSQEAP